MEYDLHSRSHKRETFSRTHRSSTKRTKGSQRDYRLAMLEDKTRAEPAQRSEASAKGGFPGQEFPRSDSSPEAKTISMCVISQLPGHSGHACSARCQSVWPRSPIYCPFNRLSEVGVPQAISGRQTWRTKQGQKQLKQLEHEKQQCLVNAAALSFAGKS